MKPATTRRLFAALLLTVLAAACASPGELEEARRQAEAARGDDDAPSLTSPPKPNDKLTARVGLVLATNNPSWTSLVGSSSKPGVVVLFVQPRGPSDGKVSRGDVVTKVDEVPVVNAERATVVLRATPNGIKNLTIAKSDDTERTVGITAKVPGAVDLPGYYGPMIDQTPTDPVLYYLRATALIDRGLVEPARRDADKAVELEPSFIDGLAVRAETMWAEASRVQGDPEKVEQLRSAAIEQWNLAQRIDAENTRVLGSLAQAQSLLGNLAQSRRFAEKAVDLDDTYPAAHMALASAQFNLGRYDTAGRSARHAVELNPYEYKYYRALTVIFMRLKRKDAAEATIRSISPLLDDASRTALNKIVEEDENRLN